MAENYQSEQDREKLSLDAKKGVSNKILIKFHRQKIIMTQK